MILLVVLVLGQLSFVARALFNRTIDDFFGDAITGDVPNYGGPNRNVISPQSEQCTTCVFQPNPALGFDQTYHSMFAGRMSIEEQQKPYTVSFKFTGVAVYIVYVLTDNSPAYNHVFLQLDTGPPQEFFHDSFVSDPNAPPTFIYNQAIFSVTGLSNTEHTVLLTSHNNEVKPTVSIFDFAIYTSEDEASDLPPSSASVAETSPAPSSPPSVVAPPPPQSTSRTSQPFNFPPQASSITITYEPSPSTQQPSGSSSQAGQTVAITKQAPTTGAIIGAIIGSIVGTVLAVGILTMWCSRRRRRRQYPLQVYEDKSFIDMASRHASTQPLSPPLPPSEVDRMRNMLSQGGTVFDSPPSESRHSEESVESTVERARMRHDLAQYAHLQQQRSFPAYPQEKYG